MYFVNENLHKTENPRWPALLAELQSLRKGAGLSPWKVRHSSELRTIIALQTGIDAEALSPAQIYEYLINELTSLGDSIEARATRNAFAVNLKTPSQSLMDRRDDFARQLGRHADTVEIYENHGIDEIANRLLTFAAYDYEGSRDTTSNTSERKQPSDVARTMITQGMSELYSLGTHASEIHKFFDRQPIPYLDTDVEWLLQASDKGEEWYRYTLKYTFRSKKDAYRIGIVASTHDCEILMASGVVDDVIKLNRNSDRKDEIKSIVQACHFVVHDTEHGNRTSLDFRELSSDECDTLLGAIWQIDRLQCNVIEVRIPQFGQGVPPVYEYSQVFDMRTDEHYAYWYAPGLMYLNNITIDFSAFPNKEEWKFFMLPFLGPIFPGALEPTAYRYSLTARNWIMQGHGFALTWQEAKD